MSEELINELLSMGKLKLVNRVIELTKELETTKKLLDESLEIVRFYGDPETYIKIYRILWEPTNPENDTEQILGYQHPGTGLRGTINPGGKRARRFLAKLNKEGES